MAIGGARALARRVTGSDFVSWAPRPLESWSPHGRWLFFSQKLAAGEPFSIMLLYVESGETRRLTWPKQQFGDAAPAYSPGAHSLVFGRVSHTACAISIYFRSPRD